MQKIIDTHIHVWDFEKAAYPWLKNDTSILNRTYTIDEIETERKLAGITNGIMVQASCNLEDTEHMLEVARNNDWICGVVAWLPLLDVEKTNQLLNDKFLNKKYFKGVRHLIHDEADPQWLLQPSVIESLKILASNNIPYDVVGVLPAHIETVLKVAELIPDLRMVFDHLNAPPITNGEKFGQWGELMQEAAKNKNIYAKISGLGTAGGNFTGRTNDEIKPYVAWVLEHFGIDKCFTGGDWPVSLLANTYASTWQNTKEILTSILTSQDLEKVYFNNANRFYNLQLV